MAFWLGLVIYYLPSPASQPAAPEAPLKGSLAAKSPSADTRQVCRHIAYVESHPRLAKHGESRGDKSPRDAMEPCQDTLTPADLAAPWRGLAPRKASVAKRSN
jgi:hypothetical protein